LSSLPSTIDGQVLTLRSISYVIKVICSYCDTIAIGDTLYEYELIWSQLSTNSFGSPRASESALSYNHRVRNGLMIVANNWTLNLTSLYWSQYTVFYNWAVLPYIGWRVSRTTQNICKSHSPQTKKVWSKSELIRISPFGRLGSNISIIMYWLISFMALYISRCHYDLMLMTLYLPMNKQLEHERIVVCSATRNKVCCR
jgi:hypothetical protein